jgi:hypothetical protein
MVSSAGERLRSRGKVVWIRNRIARRTRNFREVEMAEKSNATVTLPPDHSIRPCYKQRIPPVEEPSKIAKQIRLAASTCRSWIPRSLNSANCRRRNRFSAWTDRVLRNSRMGNRAASARRWTAILTSATCTHHAIIRPHNSHKAATPASHEYLRSTILTRSQMTECAMRSDFVITLELFCLQCGTTGLGITCVDAPYRGK